MMSKTKTFSLLMILLSLPIVMKASQNKEMKQYIQMLEKRRKSIARQNAARPTPEEQAKIDKKAEEKIQSAGQVPLKIVHIDPRASHILQVMAEVHNCVKIDDRLEIYDHAVNIIRRDEEIRNYGRIIGATDEALGHIISKL